MVGHRIWTLTHNYNGLFNKFLHVVQRSIYRPLEMVAFSTMSQSGQRGPIMPLVYTWILFKTLYWLIRSLLAEPHLSFSINMEKLSSFLTWSTLSGIEFSPNMLKCSSLSGRYSSTCYLQRKPLIVPAGNKAKRLSSVNHTTKTVHHHHHQVNRAYIFNTLFILNIF